MNFDTPEAMASHLAEAVHDVNMIEFIVRQTFPEYRRKGGANSRRKTDMHVSRFDGWFSGDGVDRAGMQNMRHGSKELLAAIQRTHLPILKKLAERNPLVVLPC